MKRKIRLLFLGIKAWKNRRKLSGHLTRKFQKYMVQIRKVTTPAEMANAMNAVRQSSNRWADIVFGNIDNRRFTPLVKLLWPEPTEPPGDPLHTELPEKITALAVPLKRGR